MDILDEIKDKHFLQILIFLKKYMIKATST